MKKLFFMFVAMAAMTFAACDNAPKTEAAPEEEAVEEVVEATDSTATAADSTATEAPADSTVTEAPADSTVAE
jgi:hypothetical protein